LRNTETYDMNDNNSEVLDDIHSYFVEQFNLYTNMRDSFQMDFFTKSRGNITTTESR
jgi:hypothetical protein